MSALMERASGDAAHMGFESLLKVDRLNVWYGADHILFNIGLEVRRGEVVALMGSSGAGKSTLMKAITGSLAERSGSICFMGNDISPCVPFDIARAGLGFVAKDRRVFTELTVGDNLEVGRRPARRWPDGSPAHHWQPAALYKLFPKLGAMQDRPGGQMSEAERQMLTVARTLMGNPYLVLLDEPSDGASPVVLEQMSQVILALKARGVSILLSEQNIRFAQLVSDRGYILNRGRIRCSGTMDDLTNDSDQHDLY